MVPSSDDVAIIGMSCRVAGANSPSELWDLLVSSKDVQSEITRFNAKGYYHPNGGPLKGLTNVKNAYMLDDETIGHFDHAFFHTTPLEAIAMDPQQRMLLEVAYEAVENAGISLEGFTGTDTAVFAGMDSCDYHLVLARDIDATPRYLATGTAACMAANRISYFFDLSGPSIALDTACSSTMVALNQAVGAIKSGESRMALVCGAKLIINPDMFIPSSELCFLSPSGRCRSFDADGDGYGRGEGVIAILLKPLEMALADNDPIRAVIKGTRLNQDGRTQGITLPSAEAQKQNMETLYKRIGISSGDIQYIEAHGTGTAAGDPLEFSAIKAVFGKSHKDNPLIIGSIKSNIGHLESAAALAAIIKTVESLERGKIPAQMHLNNPNPKLDFSNTHVPLEMMAWPESRNSVRRAGVNTFGAGGTNGHLVLESFLQVKTREPPSRRPLLFKVSAMDSASVKRLSLKYAEYVESHKPNLHDLAYTLLSRRSVFNESIYFTASTPEEVTTKLRSATSESCASSGIAINKVIFLFTGQGSQWAQMGKVLLDLSLTFRRALRECEDILASLPDKPPWSLTHELSKASETSNIYQCAFSQPLCTALQIGLVALWQSWGLEPQIVLGHSSGEIAAAYTAGLISLRDAMVIAYYRGLYLSRSTLVSNHHGKGGMCAIGSNEEDAKSILSNYGEQVQLAAVNSPTSCTLSGDAEAIQSIVSSYKDTGMFCRELRVDMAYHSHHMLPAAPKYAKALSNAGVFAKESDIDCVMYSSVTSRKLSSQQCVPDYWVENMVSTVQLFSAMTACINEHPDISLIVEIGPHPALKGPTQEILRSLGKDSVDIFHSCYRGKNDLESLLENAGAMIKRGVSLNTTEINIIDSLSGSPHAGRVLTDLPTYQWNHSTSFWTESRSSRNLRYREFPRHPLLGARCIEDTPLRPTWRNLLMLREVPWLMRLKKRGATSIPPAMFVLMAVEAARQLQISKKPGALFLELQNLSFGSALELLLFPSADSIVELHLNASQRASTDMYDFEILSVTTEDQCSSTRHCTGKFSWTTDPPASPPSLRNLNIQHNPFLVQQLQQLLPEPSVKLKDLKLGATGATGAFDNPMDEYYFLKPDLLDYITSLTSLSLLSQNIVAACRISSIASVVVPIERSSVPNAGFTMVGKQMSPFGFQSDIDIQLGRVSASIAGIRLEARHLINSKPSPVSLFYKPVMLPDITTASMDGPMGLSRCLELIAHKWPMSDIAVAGLGEKDLRHILDVLPGVRSEQRSRFRSLKILSEGTGTHSNHVRFVKDFDTNEKFHLLFVEGYTELEQMAKRLLPDGLMFVKGSKDFNTARTLNSFVRLCDVTGLSTDNWTLWHMFGNSVKVHMQKTKLFASSEQGLSSLDNFPVAEHIPLEPRAVAKFCQQGTNEKVCSVVLDNTARSAILDWTGDELVPWLQYLLASSDSIIWVSRHSSNNPFTHVAGSLLRTIQSEQPLIKVAWLVFTSGETDSFIQKTIASTYTAIKTGENEVVRQYKNSQPNILRYLPDDEMSASTGVIQPLRFKGPPVDKDYELSVAAPREQVLLSVNKDPFHKPANNSILVQVEASILDPDDLAAFACPPDPQGPAKPRLGRFFAGRALNDSGKRAFPAGSKVVGWHTGVHCNILEVPEDNLLPYGADMDAGGSVATFATMATAFSIVDGVARARTGDTFSVQLAEPLKEAIIKVCRNVGAETVKKTAGAGNLPAADFIVTVEPEKGRALSVNGKLVDIDAYLSSLHGRNTVTSAWRTLKGGDHSPLPRVPISRAQRAFEIALSEENPTYPVILDHSEPEKITGTVLTYRKPSRLFSDEGAYILVGGLGGLGRYVSTWLVANGARHLVSVSRSGLNSPEARETYNNINASKSGASMTVMIADASSHSAMSAALSQIRPKYPIKGIINMAMLLGDAPLASMAGWQWDRALRLKVDSSWILHTETTQAGDQLDFFIMFSSVASVLGNRNQAGYNLGNTFLNALCEYRRSRGQTAISIALGAMVDIGILHQLSNPALLPMLARSGLTPLHKHHLEKILEAAVIESRRSGDRSLILTGLDMFERIDGKLKGTGLREGEGIYWTECAEFGFLQEHFLSGGVGGEKGKEDLKMMVTSLAVKKNNKEAVSVLMNGFLAFLAGLLGFKISIFNPNSSLAMYGLDSLSAVSCQYWFYRELSIDISVSAILSASSIASLVKDAYTKIVAAAAASGKK